MTQVNEPEVTLNIVGANTTVPNASQKVLFVGQKVAAGSATAGALDQNILNDNSWDTLYGLNSQLAGMIRDFRKINGVTEVDAISLDDNGSGVASTGTITVTGPATEDGSLSVIIGSERNFKFEVAISDTDSATVIGDAIEAAINANTQVPITAANVTGTVTMTADNDGTLGNSIGLEVNGSVAGVTVAIAAMSGGLVDPIFTAVFDVVGKKRYQTIIWPWADVSEVVSFLDARFNVNNDILDGVGITAQTDVLANHLTALGLLNSESLVYLVDETVSTDTQKGPSQMEIPYSKAAQFGAVRSLRLTLDANISDLVIASNGPLDGFGGPAIASKPYFNTNMAFLPITDVGLGFEDTEVKQLQAAGGSIMGNNSANNGVVLGTIVTTYKTDNAGNPDISFTFLNFVDTSSNIREFKSNQLKKRFAQSRLTLGDLTEGRDMANESLISTFLNGLYNTLSQSEFVLTVAGEAALTFFKANKTITIDIANGKVTITMKVPIVTQLRIIIATMQISFDVGQ